jgi:hypothetical protein
MRHTRQSSLMRLLRDGQVASDAFGTFACRAGGSTMHGRDEKLGRTRVPGML